jgi:hypothetical protein
LEEKKIIENLEMDKNFLLGITIENLYLFLYSCITNNSIHPINKDCFKILLKYATTKTKNGYYRKNWAMAATQNQFRMRQLEGPDAGKEALLTYNTTEEQWYLSEGEKSVAMGKINFKKKG